MVILPHIRRKYMTSRLPAGATVQMSECVVTLASDSVAYTGSARTVGVTVTWGGEALSVNADYTLSFANNVNIGPATVTVTGMGQFSGSVTKTFYVISGSTPSSWSDIDISAATQETVTGSVSSGSVPFCVRGGYVFSSQSDGTVNRFTFDGQSKAFSNDGVHTNSNGYCRGFCLSRDGLHSYMYISHNGDYVYMYDHNTAWDVSDADGHYYDHGVKMPYQTQGKPTWADKVCGIDIDPTGTKLYTLLSSGYLYTHVMSTPFDVTTAVAGSMSLVDLATVIGQDHFYGFQVSQDGRSFIALQVGGVVRKLKLNTAWDMSTIDASSMQTFDASLSIGGTMYGVGISDDNKFLFIKTSLTPAVRVYSLS